MSTSHGASSAAGSEDIKRLYSISLSQIRKHSLQTNYNYKPSPFNIRWIHGYNSKTGVINLNNEGSTIAFYAAGNCGILYNWTSNEMRILQGHRHVLTCIASDNKGKWLVTADTGPENVLIIWDSGDFFPQKTLFSPHKEMRIAKATISGDAKYLLTLGYREKAVVHWWIWSYGENEPHATHEVAIPRNGVLDMAFSNANSEQFVLMTKHDIWIGVSEKEFVVERGILKETDRYLLRIRQIPRKQNAEFGLLTCFTFVKETSQILAGTSRGCVLVYGYTAEYQENVETGDINDMKFVKGLKIEQARINVIKNIDGVIVTGNGGGGIHFYDTQMKLLYWIHGFTVDKVMGLSFNISPRSYQILDPKCNTMCLCWEKVVVETNPETGAKCQKLMKSLLPSDATVGSKPFVVRDFLVCTKKQGVGFVDFIKETKNTILNSRISPALSLAAHPEKSFVCVGYGDGTIDMFNFVQHMLFARLDLRDHFKVVTVPSPDSITCFTNVTLPQLSVTCLKYSPSGALCGLVAQQIGENFTQTVQHSVGVKPQFSCQQIGWQHWVKGKRRRSGLHLNAVNGLHLACGLNNGQLIFLDPTTIEIHKEKSFHDLRHAIKEFAYSPDSLTLACADIGRNVCVYKYDCTTLCWKFIGKHRAHYKEITSVFFLPEKNDNGDHKLVSIGADRCLVEYDIGATKDGCLEIFSLDRVDQTAIPLAGIPWQAPADLDLETCRADLPLILIANNEHKYKIVNYKTTMTLSTVLGPRFEHPVRKIQLVSRRDEEGTVQYILFATKNIVGLQKMPLDGNPWKHIGLLGHPIEVTQMCFRDDIGALFTIGAKDGCLTQWAGNSRALDTTAKLGGADLDPYYCLVENGRPGWLFREIRDLFYYIQILCQGTFSPSIRRVKDYIPIETLPDLMRALGYFPSEYEVENIIVEAKYKVYQWQPSMEIDFEEFVKLYLNHRPAFSVSSREVKNAFRNFATIGDNTYTMTREEFIGVLSNFGERLPKEVIWYLLSILCGHSFEDRETMLDDDFSFLPEAITLTDFLGLIMGLQDYDVSEQFSGKESCCSQLTSGSDSDEG